MKRALLKQDREITSTTPYRLSLESSVTDIFNSSSSETLYDELTLQQLRLLKERALPIWKSDDADPVRMQRVTEKALSMRLLESVSNQLMESDLRDSFEALRSYFRSLNDFLRYSVQSDGDSLSVTSKNRGKKWIEFRPEINLRQGIDPQIRIGERLRFRYDYLDKRPYLEFSLDF
ncbi:MAG: hypothetical protein KDD64_10010 [Bdellovibrionales bacterium]|nr:hypothetical protein [Bdellovibrionales bacterium]